MKSNARQRRKYQQLKTEKTFLHYKRLLGPAQKRVPPGKRGFSGRSFPGLRRQKTEEA
jgi:hypothetical protein